jgi:DeoR family transcriptional regulator, aga operon transcriptional repressor
VSACPPLRAVATVDAVPAVPAVLAGPSRNERFTFGIDRYRNVTETQPIVNGIESESSVPADVRRLRMLDVVRDRDYVKVAELADQFSISEVTVRSDLEALASRGDVRRIRGGAIATSVPRRERAFEESEAEYAGEKLAIGRAAAGLVRSGDTVILDVGTTTAAIGRAMAANPELRDVVVFTNSLTIAVQLEPVIPRFTVVVTGGTLRPLQHSLVDPLGDGVLDRIRADMVFIGCNGVDPVAGVTNINLPEAEMKRRMMASARRRIVVADGSKVGHVELARLCPVTDVDLLMTGASADASIVAALVERGMRVEVVEA